MLYLTYGEIVKAVELATIRVSFQQETLARITLQDPLRRAHEVILLAMVTNLEILRTVLVLYDH